MSERIEGGSVEEILPRPVPVWVDMGQQLTAALGDGPFWLRTAGLRVSADPTPGVLVRWIRSSRGGWLGLCEVVMASDDGHVKVEAKQLVPARFIRPR